MVEAAGRGGAAADIGPPAPPSSADLVALCRALREPHAAPDDAARIERIHRLEQARAAIAAAQAVEVAAFAVSRRAAALAEIAAVRRPGVGKRRRIAEAERGIVTDVATARRVSPTQAARFMKFAATAPTELPHAFTLLARGELSEHRTLTVHRATTWLTPDQRRTVDGRLAPKLAGWGDRQVLAEAQAAGYRLDPQGACDRAALAAKDRCVSMRPAPESMTRLSASLPLTQGVAVYAALDRAARTATAAGDPRTRGQIMADTLVERITGQTTAAAVPVAVTLVMTDQTLLGQGAGADEPVRIVGGGWLPAPIGRNLVLGDPTGSCDTSDTAVTVRRLFTDHAGHLVAMETSSRLFTPAMAEFIRIRDDLCRTPWCDAPIRHIDHIEPATDGGPTTITNGRGLCERCNLAAQAGGSTSRPVPDISGAHTVVGLTPMGQPQRSTAPDPPGVPPPPRDPSGIDVIWIGRNHHRDAA